MPIFADFLQVLLQEGRAIVREPPGPIAHEQPEALDILERFYRSYRLQVAGPPIPFDAAKALAAGELVCRACWFLVSHAQPDVALDECLTMPGPPQTPQQHLSADLVLHFLPQIHQRARSINPADRLPVLLAKILREWPLSGVLSSIEEGPLTSLDFAHPGLQMLYAERLAHNEKPAWIPEGRAMEYVEMVWREMGKDFAALVEARRLDKAAPDREEDGKCPRLNRRSND